MEFSTGSNSFENNSNCNLSADSKLKNNKCVFEGNKDHLDEE